MQNHLRKLFLVTCVTGIGLSQSFGQCDGNVPNLVVDLSSSPTATYLSPFVVRNGYCCGVTGNDRCLRFEITLHPDAQGITFDVCAGAVPGGAMFYQINCGPMTAVGTPICLDGEGPHILTFCKPGNNDNQYCITSLPNPAAGPSIAVNDGCIGTITSSGFAPGSVQWTSVFPGPVGAYNNYLSCPTCPTTDVTAQPGYPAYVDYQVCGLALSPCSNVSYCDTVRVNFYSTLTVNILPQMPTVCFGATGTTITANGSGGLPPYSFLWNNGLTTPTIYVGPGTYTVTMSDNSDCPPTTASVVVTQFMQPIDALAGTDIVVCGVNNPVAQLSGTVTGVTTGEWITGSGQFNPSITALNATYTPTQAEINAGFVDLVLMTTNNGTCPGDQDTVRVHFDPGILNGDVSAVNASCNGGANGSAAFTPADPTYTYSWTTAPEQTSATATGLAAGNYSVTATTALGCSVTLTVTIGQPSALVVASVAVVNESCSGTNDGSVTVTMSGGTPPYTYTWNVAGNGPTITGTAGDYTVNVIDANGCEPVQTTATIDVDGLPNIADAGADLIACDGDYPIPLQGNVTNATGGYWSGGAGNFTGTGLNVQYQPTATEIQAGSVTLTLTTTGNTSCPPATDQTTISLSNAFLNAQLTSTNVTCAGIANGSAVFSPALPGLQYQWQGMPQQTGPAVNGLAAGTHAVQVTDQLGCTETFTTSIIEPPLLIIVDASSTPVSCNGYSDGTATVLVEGGTPPYSYLWGPTTEGQVSVTATGLAVGNHGVTITDANGCAVSTTRVVAEPAPLTLAASVPETVCINTPVQLTANATGGTGVLQIQWTGIGSGSPIVHAFTEAQTVTVSVSDANNCPGPILNFPITVLDLQSADLETYGDTTVCPGGHTYVGANLTNYQGAYTVTWPEIGTTGNGPFFVPINSNNTMNVIITDQCSQVIYGTVSVAVESPPNITLPEIIAEGCSPLSVQFPTGLTNQTVSYSWQMGNGTTSTQVSPQAVYNTGTYTVSLTVTTPAGCTATASNTGQIIVHGGTAVSFTASPWITNIDNASVDFTPVIAGDAISTYWTFGDGGTSNAINPTHVYTDVGSYQVTLLVLDANGCTSEAIRQVEITPVYDITVPNIFTPDLSGNGSGIYDPWALNNDVFYPFIRFVKDFRMRVFNRWGELIFESNDIQQGWNGYYRDQLSPQDVYVYQLWVRFVDGTEKHKLGDVTLAR